MSNRDQEAAKKRAAITSSADFKVWWYYRKQAPNRPADPYHAYQTDKALRAPKAEDRQTWGRAPNRADYEVDSPGGYSRAPSPKPAQPARKQIPYKRSELKSEYSREMPRNQWQKTVTLKIDELAQKYGQASPTIKFLPQRGSLASSARTGVGRSSYFGLMPTGNQPLIKVGISSPSKGARAMQLAAAAHEAGHVFHAQMSLKPATQSLASYGVTKSYSATGHNYGDERAAWQLAEPLLKSMKGSDQASARWLKKVALHSYSHSQQGKVTNYNPAKKSYTIDFRGAKKMSMKDLDGLGRVR